MLFNEYYSPASQGMQLRSGKTINCIETTPFALDSVAFFDKTHPLYVNGNYDNQSCADAIVYLEYHSKHIPFIHKMMWTTVNDDINKLYYILKSELYRIIDDLEFSLDNNEYHLLDGYCGCNDISQLNKDFEESDNCIKNGPGYLCEYEVYNGNGQWRIAKQWVPYDMQEMNLCKSVFEAGMKADHIKWRHNIPKLLISLKQCLLDYNM
jgi:hypothetical protein